ncbi:MAG: hypothetical protein HQK54_06570 [Oligoflexales bacterium]|nr:hypothetical protein [Oligoflexales bacterium]
MKIVCSFCRCSMGEKPPYDNLEITSGICTRCFETESQKWLKIDYLHLLQGVENPAAVVSRDIRIYAVNEPFNRLLGIGDNEDPRGLLCGEVLKCMHPLEQANTGMRCGDTSECSSCPIRKSITNVFDTKIDLKNVPAWFKTRTSRCEIIISVYYKGNETVLLVIENIFSHPN